MGGRAPGEGAGRCEWEEGHLVKVLADMSGCSCELVGMVVSLWVWLEHMVVLRLGAVVGVVIMAWLCVGCTGPARCGAFPGAGGRDGSWL